MQVLDLLRKLGIIRFGAKSATYTSAKDRPYEFMDNSVFNAEKDLVHKGDFKADAPLNADTLAPKECTKCKAPRKPGARFCGQCGQVIN
jgi:hypothetical protein